jgi:adenosyl cobinamide kinase/adenosyl cobinamide phosphate guanylyltransferase
MYEAFVKPVEALPALDQSKFPEVPKQTNLLIPYNTTGQKDTECILGIVAFVAALSNRWVPVSIDQFEKILTGTTFRSRVQQIVHATWLLARDGYVEIVRVPVGDQVGDYIVPNPHFARLYSDPCAELQRAC